MNPTGLLGFAAGAGLTWAGSGGLDARPNRGRLDLAFALAVCAWAVALVFALQGQSSAVRGGLGTVVALQLALLSAERFFLMAANCWRRGERLWLMGHCLCVVVWVCMVAGSAAGPSQARLLHVAPMWMNLVFAGSLIGMLAARAWQLGRGRTWAVLLVAMPVCAIFLSEMVRSHATSANPVGLQPLVGMQLCLLWVFIRRGERLTTRCDDDTAAAHTQLAQDLHDGVGYHLTSIIASLEDGTPQQRATAASLQQCLLELKLLVDGAVTEGTVLCHLANLRYRTQPLLDAAGIAMRWDMEETESLEHLKGDTAVQVLRVAQEALANVIRHSGARRVVVRSQVSRSRHEFVLEIQDNGQGFSTAGSFRQRVVGSGMRGRGLRGMHARAQRLGGSLRVDSAPGRGARVQLRVPLGTARRDHRA